MKNIPYDPQLGLDLPPEIQLRRLNRVIQEELTEKQRRYLCAYYFEELRPSQIARRYGVQCSTVIHTLHRAEDKLRRFLTY